MHKEMEGHSIAPPAAFSVVRDGRRSSDSQPRISYHRSQQHSGSSKGPSHERFNQKGSGRRPPCCQICRGPHYADKCPWFLNARSNVSSANLAQAFSSQRNVSAPTPDRIG